MSNGYNPWNQPGIGAPHAADAPAAAPAPVNNDWNQPGISQPPPATPAVTSQPIAATGPSSLADWGQIIMDPLRREQLLGGRAIGEGVAALPEMLYNAPTSVYHAATGKNLYEPMSYFEKSVQPAVTKYSGTPLPTNTPESLLYAGGLGVGATLPTLGAGELAGMLPYGQAVARVLSGAPGVQVGAAGTGGAASQEVANLGGPEWAQMAAGMAPGVLTGFHPSMTAKTGFQAASDINLANAGRAMGIDITPAAVTGKVAGTMSKVAGMLPGAGTEAATLDRYTQWKQALAKTAGIDNITDPETKFTPDTFGQIEKVINGKYGSVTNYGGNVPTTPGSTIGDALTAVEKTLDPQNQWDRPVQKFIDNLRTQAQNGMLTRDEVVDHLATTSRLSKYVAGGPENAPEFQQIYDALNDGLKDVSTPEQIQALDEAKYNYKNYMTLKAATDQRGEITPQALVSALKNNKYQNIKTNDSDMRTLMQIGDRHIAMPEDIPPAKQVAATLGSTIGGPLGVVGVGETARAMEGLPLGNLAGMAPEALGAAAVGWPLGVIYSRTGRLGPIPTPGTNLGQIYARMLLHGQQPVGPATYGGQ